ncbi:MAG: BrnT family toxin [bacterium]
MYRIEIEWDDESIEHIWFHQVEPKEVEEVLRGKHLFQRGKRGSCYGLGQTEGGRYLFIVLSKRPSGRFKVVTAREMTETEQRRFKSKVGR